VVSVLLKAGAQVDAKSTSTGGTALHFASVLTENPEVISLLLRAGADPDLRDDYGKTALDYARKNELLQGTDALKALKAARYQ
jgi:ankyrin repeat protein